MREKETHMAESATAVANGPCNVAVTESVWLVVGVSWLGYPGLSSHVVAQLPLSGSSSCMINVFSCLESPVVELHQVATFQSD